MADPTPKRLEPAEALAAAVRERLTTEGTLTLPGLGTLRRHHQPARVGLDEEGRQVLLPPQHVVRFEPSA